MTANTDLRAPDFLSSLKYLNLLGLWSGDKNDKNSTRIYWIYSATLNIFFAGMFNVGQIIYMFANPDLELELFIKTSLSAFGGSLVTIRSIFFVFKSQSLRSLLEDLKNEQFQPKNQEQTREFRDNMKLLKSISRVYTFMMFLMVLLWIFGPQVQGGKRLIVLSWYPYEWRNRTNVFVVTYLHQSIGGALTCFVNVFLDLLGIAFMLYIGAECDVLSNTLRNLMNFAMNVQEETTSFLDINNFYYNSNDAMNNTLIRCMSHHRAIVRFAKNFESFYGVFIFAQFAVTLTTICTSLFFLTLLSSTDRSEVLSTVVYQLVIFMQLFIYCWFSNNVTVKSEKITMALYECPWYACRQNFKKNLLFFMMRSSQKSIQIRALDYFPVNLASYLWIVQTAWSAFLCLQQVNQQN